MILGKYILEGHEPVPCHDLLEWGRWFDTANRCVAITKIGKAEVCTHFIGIDMRFGEGPPVLFETMVFGGEFNGDQMRSSTWEEVKRDHAAMVACLEAKAGLLN